MSNIPIPLKVPVWFHTIMTISSHPKSNLYKSNLYPMILNSQLYLKEVSQKFLIYIQVVTILGIAIRVAVLKAPISVTLSNHPVACFLQVGFIYVIYNLWFLRVAHLSWSKLSPLAELVLIWWCMFLSTGKKDRDFGCKIIENFIVKY